MECCNDAIDEETQKKIVETFEENKLDPNDFPVKINAGRARYLQKWVKEYIPYLKENVKMANAYEKRVSTQNKITWAITIVLAIMTMIPLVLEGEGLVILFGILAWGAGFVANTKLSTVFAIAAIILLPVWIITFKPALGAFGIACIFISFLLIDRADKRNQENNQ